MLLARGDNTLELLKPFADELARLQPGDPQAERVLDAVAAAQLDDPNEAYVMFIGLMQALNDLSPDGMYFGPSPQDPFSFGWWPASEAVMHMNAIRQETGRLEPRELARMAPFTPESIAKKKQKDIEAREKAIAKGKEPPVGYAPTLEEKLVEAKASLVQINELQEAGALFIHNNSGGKDSHAMLIYMIEVLGIPVEQIVSVHADLGRQEWELEKYGKTIDVAKRIADHYGVQFEAVEHRRGVSILERLTQRAMTMIVKGKYGPAKPPKAAAPPKKPRKGAKVREVPEWYDHSKYRPGAYELTASPAPSKGQRWCTSEFKTAPCRQMATSLLVERGGHVIVHGLGLRAEESSDRGQQPMLEVVSHTDRSTNFSPPAPLTVYNWLPIQLWTTNEVFRVIEAAGQERHWIYGENLTRASCSFCIYSSPEDLTLAAKMRPDLYAEYVAVERTYGKTFTLKRQFLEEMTGVQADEALVAQAREKLVPLEQLVEQHGGVLKGKAPETELQKYRQLGFTEEARAEILARPGYAGVYEDEEDEADDGGEEEKEEAPAPRERLVSPSLLARKPLHAQAELSDEDFFESLELVENARGRTPIVLNWGMGADSSNILGRVLLDDRSREDLGIATDYSNLLVLTAQVGHEYDETKALGEKYILPLMRERGVRFIQVGRSSPVTADWRVIEDTREPYTLHTEGAGFTLGDEMHAAATVPQYRASSRLCSQKFKGVPLDGWLEQEFGDRPFVQLMGFNADEVSRAERDDSYTAKGELNRTARYPLIEWGVGRDELERELKEMFGVRWAKSCCGFCPFQGTKAGREGVLTRAANEPERAADAMWMELVSTSLNPKQTLYASKGGAIGFYREGGAAAAVAALDRRLAESEWGLYHVRRALFQTKTGNKQGARDLKLVASGSRAEMAAELAELAVRKGLSIEESEYGILRLWVEHREDRPETREELYVVAPKVAADKIGRAFEKRWIAGAPRTALRMAPEHAQIPMADEDFFESLELVPNAAEMGDFFFGEPPARSMARNARKTRRGPAQAPTHVSTGDMPKVLSYGGGLDSFAMLLGSIERDEKPDYVVFVNVGSHAAFMGDPKADPGEWSSTYRHIREVVMPLCEEQGIPFLVLDDSTGYPVRKGGSDEVRDAYGWLFDHKNIPIANEKRNCTATFKVERFEMWMMDTFGNQPVEVWIGFEKGEEKRIEKDPHMGLGLSNRRNRFPLFEWNLCRCRAERYVRELGYPVPRKSACTFCPFSSKNDWRALAREEPKTFARIAELEQQKPPTEDENLRLTIMNWTKWKLSQAQHDALKQLAEGRPGKINKTTRESLEGRQWVKDGRITEHGREVLKLVPPPTVSPEGKVVEAKVVDYIPPERRIANVHYQAPSLYEALELGDEKTKGKQCPVCGANPKATKQTGCDYLPPEEGVGPEQVIQLRVPLGKSKGGVAAPRATPGSAQDDVPDEEFFASLEMVENPIKPGLLDPGQRY